MSLVFDIETSAFDFESLSESQQEYLLRYAEKETEESLREFKREEAIRYLSLYPFTAKVIVIGMLNTETEHSMVLYEGEGEETSLDEKQVIYKPLSEAEMLKYFWDMALKCEQIISFNGRQFDIPFLMLRSSVLEIKPSRNFLKNRYKNNEHLDLLEELTFHGLTRKFNLDFYCQAYGIESPKSKGISGMDVKELYDAGKTDEIACYCHDDITATYELFKIWKNYLRF